MTYVFGYGSLVSAVNRPFPATLAGWRTAWIVGSDTGSHPEREFRDPAGRPYDGVVAVLGIEPEPGAVCPGAVFAVDADALPALDRRERNYERRDVTDVVDWPGKPRRCLVFAYVPTPEARRRLVDAGATGREVVVRSRYLALCRSVPPPPFPVRDLTQHVRSTTGSVRGHGVDVEESGGVRVRAPVGRRDPELDQAVEQAPVGHRHAVIMPPSRTLPDVTGGG